MNKFIAIEPDACIGCGTCLAACSQGHREVGLQAQPRLALASTYAVTAAVTCHHCEGAPCMVVCPVGAITRSDEGVVEVNEQTCVGCKLCACVCPFGAIHPSGTSIAGVAGIKYDTPTLPRGTSALLAWEVGVCTRAVKCDMCSFDPAGPHCVQACLTGALSVQGAGKAAAARKEKQIAAAQANELVMRTTSTIRRP